MPGCCDTCCTCLKSNVALKKVFSATESGRHFCKGKPLFIPYDEGYTWENNKQSDVQLNKKQPD